MKHLVTFGNVTKRIWKNTWIGTEAHWYQGSYIKLSGYRHLKVSGRRHLKKIHVLNLNKNIRPSDNFKWRKSMLFATTTTCRWLLSTEWNTSSHLEMWRGEFGRKREFGTEAHWYQGSYIKYLNIRLTTASRVAIFTFNSLIAISNKRPNGLTLCMIICYIKEYQ